jgi:predicted nucleic-acid-binding protein
MIAFDTNLLVRLVGNDDKKQVETAESLLETSGSKLKIRQL